jgi:acyl carrier protein
MTLCGGTARADGFRNDETVRNNLLFHKESGFWHIRDVNCPRREPPVLREANNSIVENDDMSDTLVTVDRGAVTRAEVMGEICHHLAPFQIGEKPITGATVITKDLAVDSLAVMDMVMEIEDRFDVSIPMNLVAEIYTVDELADTVLKLRARR